MTSSVIVVQKTTPKEVASCIINTFGVEKIKYFYKKFEWQNCNFLEAVEKRNILEEKMRHALIGKDDSKIDEVINDIYYWGFKRLSPNTRNEDWKIVARDLVKSFSAGGRLEKIDLLNKILNEKGIGIATASKWTCFCDQTKYAIYDSRVSLALRSIVTQTEKRIFPTVARRSTKNRQYPVGDAISAQEMTEKYFFYLDTLQEMNEMIDMSAAQIEMALFMIGKDVHNVIS